MSRVPGGLWPRARDDLLHHPRALRHVHDSVADARFRTGRFRFRGPRRRGSCLLTHLPSYYEGGRGVYEWIGPALPDECDPLRTLRHERFSKLPIGIDRL